LKLSPREETLMKIVSLLEYCRFVDGLDAPTGPPETWLSPKLAADAQEHELPLQEIIDYIWT
jgi:hypothetical protein